MNLLMSAPLCDSRGKIRYYIGAQIDVSGLVKDAADLDGFQRLLEMQERGQTAPANFEPSEEKNDEFQELSEMFNTGELDTVRRHGGRMHRDIADGDDDMSVASQRPRLLLKEPSIDDRMLLSASGMLSGVYQNVGSLFSPHFAC